MNKKITVGILSFMACMLMATGASALTEQEVKDEFKIFLDRDPTSQELRQQKSKRNLQDLKSELNKGDERRETINSLYQRALKRNARDNEVEALKRFGAPIKKIKDQLFTSEERKEAIKDAYRNLLGRDPAGNDQDFYVRTRSDFGKIKDVLSKSNERKDLVKKFYEKKGKKFSDGEFEKNRLRRISDLKEEYGIPDEIMRREKKLKGIIHDAKEQLKDLSQVKRELRKKMMKEKKPMKKKKLMPCVIADGSTRKKGVCRYEMVHASHFEALKDFLADNVQALRRLGDKVLLIKFREFNTVGEIESELNKSQDAPEALPIEGYDEKIEEMGTEVDEAKLDEMARAEHTKLKRAYETRMAQKKYKETLEGRKALKKADESANVQLDSEGKILKDETMKKAKQRLGLAKDRLERARASVKKAQANKEGHMKGVVAAKDKLKSLKEKRFNVRGGQLQIVDQEIKTAELDVVGAENDLKEAEQMEQEYLTEQENAENELDEATSGLSEA